MPQKKSSQNGPDLPTLTENVIETSRGPYASGWGGSADPGEYHSTARSESGSDLMLSEINFVSPMHRLASAVNEDARAMVNASPAESLGNSIFYDTPDGAEMAVGGTPDPQMTQKAIEQVQAKIEKTIELITEEQKSRDENVNEYLTLSSNADKQQQLRIKHLFEKKNQKSAQNVAQLQKKLEDYQKKLQLLQEHGIKAKSSRKLGKGLKNVGENIREGITEMSTNVMSKPKEFAHKIRHKFGSADDLSSLDKNSSDNGKNKSGHTGSASLPRDNSGLSEIRTKSSFENQQQLRRKCISDDGRENAERSHSNITSTSTTPSDIVEVANHGKSNQHFVTVNAANHDAKDDDDTQQNNHTEWKTVMQELTLHKEEVDTLREDMDGLRQHFQSEIETLHRHLRDERDRYERLEEQINDLTELHQHEIENIKSAVNDMEEKVQYQSEERLIDIKEHLQGLETKVTSMEHQQTQQQYLNIEGLNSNDTKVLLMKLLTAGITLIHVILFAVGMLMSLLKSFVGTRRRAAVSTLVVSLAIAIHLKMDYLESLIFKPN